MKTYELIQYNSLFNILLNEYDDKDYYFGFRDMMEDEEFPIVKTNILRYIWLVLTRKTTKTDKYYSISSCPWGYNNFAPTLSDYLFNLSIEIHDGIDVRTDSWDNEPWEISINIIQLLWLYLTGRMLPKNF